MKAGAAPRGLQILLTVMGIVMVVAGAGTVVLGAESVPREGVVTPDVDTEMRFYAIWYVVGGVLLLRAVRNIAAQGFVVRAIAVGFFVGGCARVLSWIVVGRPHAIAITLMVLELLLPVVIVPWQASIERRSRSEP